MDIRRFMVLRDELPSPQDAQDAGLSEKTLAAANKAVARATSSQKSRKSYAIYDGEFKATVAKHALVYGVNSALGRFKEVPRETLRGWLKELKRLSMEKKISPQDVKELSSSKRGRPLALGEKLDEEVEKYIALLAQRGCPINRLVVCAAAKAIQAFDRLSSRSFTIGPSWAKSFLLRKGYVCRKANSDPGLLLPESAFEERRKQFHDAIAGILEEGRIHPSLIINGDQTPLRLTPEVNYTFARKGTRHVRVLGKKNKMQVTLLLSVTCSGHMLPPQIIFKGKTRKCHGEFKFPSSWHVTHTNTHTGAIWIQRSSTSTQSLHHTFGVSAIYLKRMKALMRHPFKLFSS